MSFNRKEQRNRRHMRLRQRVKGTAARPRMAICISNKHMYVQFVDDVTMHTLAATSTLKKGEAKPCNLETAKLIGEQAASVAKEKGISIVVVDRGGFKFHGRVKQIVDAATAAGLKISERAVETAAEEAK
ncbi:MAG: 50S ribosomal protein L18 [Verrucomicrobiota bacterium]|jgi:large subunit ribosomal protein L18|nr:50S ribosomal protein L18 [Verrucomicrobiota bacterium]